MELTLTAIVKFISLALAAGFAILGTTTDYKKKGKITKWGRIAIIGVVISGLVSVVILGIEESTKAQEKRDSTAKSHDADIKANEEKKALNQQFDSLVSKAEENIRTTSEALSKTDQVARDLQKSVIDQRNLINQTQNISGGVNKGITQQGNILDQIRRQLSLQRETFNKTQILQQQQDVVLQNTLRSLSSFKQFKLRYSLRLPTDSLGFQFFVNDLRNYILSREPGNPTDKVGKIPKSRTVDGFPFPEGPYILVLRDSPYFSVIKEYEWRYNTSNLTKSLLGLNFFTEPNESDPRKADLSITMGAWGLSKQLENDFKDYDIKPSFISQSFDMIVLLEMEPVLGIRNGIYIDVETNVILEWKDYTHRSESFADLPGTTMRAYIPCGSELLSFEFLTGDNYGTIYAISPEKGIFDKKNCTASFSLKKSDFGFP